jgi:hypothetical protein
MTNRSWPRTSTFHARGMTIDGREFPWHVSVDGFEVTVSKNDLPGVTVTIVAERVTVDHAISKHALD